MTQNDNYLDQLNDESAEADVFDETADGAVEEGDTYVLTPEDLAEVENTPEPTAAPKGKYSLKLMDILMDEQGRRVIDNGKGPYVRILLAITDKDGNPKGEFDFFSAFLNLPGKNVPDQYKARTNNNFKTFAKSFGIDLVRFQKPEVWAKLAEEKPRGIGIVNKKNNPEYGWQNSISRFVW